MNEYRIRDSRGHFNVHSHEMMRLLGLRAGGHLPAEGMPIREIQGFKVWVLSKEDARHIGAFHRVQAQCPNCNWVGSAGRLHQHKCK